MTRILWLFVAACALFVASCEDEITPPNNNNTEQGGEQGDENGNENGGENGDENQGENGGENGNENQGENGNENGDDKEWSEPLPEADYAIAGRITASEFVNFADGRRNDYISFYDELNGYVLYIDLYTDESNAFLPSGDYPLADGFDNCAYREYTYFTPTPSSDLVRFTEGWVSVIADENDPSGYTLHKIRAYFTMTTGETVSLDYTGTLIAH